MKRSITALVLALALLLTAAFTAVAEEAAPISIQLVGAYVEEGEGASRVTAAFKLNLLEDGTVEADRYRYLEGNVSDAAENPTYDNKFMTGTWANSEKDGIECLKIDIACTDESGAQVNAQTLYAYDFMGDYSVDMSFPIIIGMQYQRQLTVEGSAEVRFADDNALIAAYKQEGAATEAPAAEAPAAEAPAAPVEGECIYAGEYDVTYGDAQYYEEFIIEADGSVHGMVDASGLTGFEGTVDAEGNITAEFVRLGGTMTGTVDAEGNVQGHCEVRGRESDFTGVKFD